MRSVFNASDTGEASREEIGVIDTRAFHRKSRNYFRNANAVHSKRKSTALRWSILAHRLFGYGDRTRTPDGLCTYPAELD
jgi:hypothetical protein